VLKDTGPSLTEQEQMDILVKGIVSKANEFLGEKEESCRFDLADNALIVRKLSGEDANKVNIVITLYHHYDRGGIVTSMVDLFVFYKDHVNYEFASTDTLYTRPYSPNDGDIVGLYIKPPVPANLGQLDSLLKTLNESKVEKRTKPTRK